MNVRLLRGIGFLFAMCSRPALLLVAAISLVVCAFCWTVKNRERTTNAVDLISAFRRARPDETSTGRAAKRGRGRPPIDDGRDVVSER